jgi:lysozyme family protein
MANFEAIIPWILYQEDSHTTPGKIVNLGDGAGFTRLGITERWHQTQVPPNFFSTMSFKDAVTAAKIVYKQCYWNFLDGDSIASDLVAAPLLSFAVNATPKVAVKTLQRVLEVVEDGSLGPKTLAELNSKDPGVTATLFRAEWINFYHRDVDANPSKAKFLNGWVNRANFPYPSNLVPGIYQ